MSKDPYKFLGEQLVAAARRQDDTHEGRTGRVRNWLSRHLSAATLSGLLVLGGGAAAVAATGVLSGSPVRQSEGPLSPTVGDGIPAAGGSRLLALRVADPEGGLPWGIRMVHTTRGQVCAQIGRIDDGQLGELGIDGAFHDDGRFHPLPPDVLPAQGSSNQTQCVLAGQVFSYEDSSKDRNAATIAFEAIKVKPPTRDLRSISYGLLGPHALSVTYKSTTGSRTLTVSRGSGAYLIVRPAGPIVNGGVGTMYVGYASAVRVGDRPIGVVSAATYRFGSLLCSVGTGSSISTRCPEAQATPESAFAPTRSLNQPVRVLQILQSEDSCRRAFLSDPCYRAEVEFKAPYSVTSAGSEYDVLTKSVCNNARLAGWPIDRDVDRGETVRSLSTGSFKFCASPQQLEIRYLNRPGPSAKSPNESIVLGAGAVSKPTSSPRAPPHKDKLPVAEPVNSADWLPVTARSRRAG